MTLLSGMLQLASATAYMPETELSWKNVSFNGRTAVTHCLLLDSRGMVWAGTNNGLHFYDGITTHQILDPDLAGAQIYAMTEHDGLIYLGTNHGLLTLGIEDCDVKKTGDGEPKEIRSLLLSGDTLWIGSLYGVYAMEPGKDGPVTPTTGLPHSSTYSILRDSRGIIYAGTYDGLAKWDPVKKSFTAITSRPETRKPHNLFVNSLLESGDGTFLYVGCEGGLYKYHIASDCWESMPEMEGNNIKCMGRLGRQHLIIGSDNGVYDLHNDTLRHYRHDSRIDNTLADNEIWCLLTDNDSNVWAGHQRGFSISSHSNAIRTLRLSSIAHTGDGNEIHCICRDSRGELWLGGTNGVLRLSKDGTAEWHRHDNSPGSLSHNRIRAISEDSGGNIWLSTDAGLNRYDRSRNQFDIFNIVDSAGGHATNWTYTLREDDKGNFWTGGFLSGVHRVPGSRLSAPGGIVMSDMALNATGGNSMRDSHRIENDLVNDIAIDRSGNVWILLFRDDVVARYNTRTGSMTRFRINEIAGSSPSRIAKDSRGRIWCAFNGGAVIFDDDRNPEVIRFASPSGEEAAVAMAPVGGDMWISTCSNLWKIDGTTLKASILPIPQKAYTAISEDSATAKVLLGGIDEILEIDPSGLAGDSVRRHISFILADNDNRGAKRYDPDHDGTITIPYGGSLSLTVSSLDYSPEAVHRYMYKLSENEPDDTDGWVVLPEGVNTIMFTDLKMGDYKVMVTRVGMADIPVAIPLKVRPPVWLSWWAILTYILIASAAVYAVIACMHRRQLRRYREEERRKSLENVEKKLTFLSNISHDLKTPLSMILGPVSLMKERARDADTRKSLETVYDNAVRLNNMIHKTIELQHLENADDSLLIVSTFDAVEFCRGVFETFKENHPQKKFVFHSSCSELFIEGDAVKFESVITNLLSNACKYSEEDSTISLGICRQGDNVEIAVSDDGLGIEENDQPLVFQRMFRAPSTANLREGTGLGLYLIKKYLELMNGNINLYSRPGQGTSFMITLPISEKAASAGPHETGAADASRPKILIVEDNAEISAFITKILERDYTVLAAENGRSGLAIASSFMPDLIIADEMMPIMTGLEMCRRMRQMPRLASTPIIMLTARTDPRTENESVRLGIDAFMAKPFDPAVLIGRIRHLLKSRDAIREKLRIETLTEAKPIEAESPTEKQLAKIAKIIEENISDPDLNVNYLSEKSGLPQKQLYRVIKKYMDIAPVDYIRRVRLQKAAMLLSQKRFTVSEISYMVGFKTPSYFAKCFHAQYGVKPSQYKSDDEK